MVDLEDIAFSVMLSIPVSNQYLLDGCVTLHVFFFKLITKSWPQLEEAEPHRYSHLDEIRRMMYRSRWPAV